jgi:hypothetical protein
LIAGNPRGSAGVLARFVGFVAGGARAPFSSSGVICRKAAMTKMFPSLPFVSQTFLNRGKGAFDVVQSLRDAERNTIRVISDGRPMRTGKPFHSPVPLLT